MSNTDVTQEGQLEYLEGSLVRGRLGESSRLYRLCIDGRWHFCKASDFHDSKQAQSFLRHVRLPARVTVAPYVVNGRHRIGWIHVHGTGEALHPSDPFRMAGLTMMAALVAATLCLAMYVGWPWVSTWPKAAFVVSLPLIIALAVVTLFCLFAALTMVLESVSQFRPSRVRAFFAYRRLHGGSNA